ncbi:GntR family transcriptional regulator [Trinickia violacea]|uniref:GntR family transcriptional regulator n=1 Tax=Trinickia violacea TaxID=2571746 RepID=A0A4V1EIK5_9BURK|nr:GntR family transcriptional regulator [Trinickia violacea]QCP54090.1 GntR family transcriptional regulator [Trinickia violacea]
MEQHEGMPGDAGTSAASSQTVKAQLGLRELILAGEVAPGARITELWAVERLGMSRTPVRAALMRLQDEGLLDPVPSGGYAVRSFSSAEIYDAIELRGTMEGMAARLAAERGVEAGLMASLRECVSDIDILLEDPPMTEAKFSQYVELNERFHRLLASACNSSVVERQLAKAMALPFASPSGFVKVQAVAPDAYQVLVVAQAQHRAVLDAIERREGARAEALMREHARIAHRNLENALKNQTALTQLFGASLIRQWSAAV